MIQITAILSALTLFIGLYTGYQYATGKAAKGQVQALVQAKEKWQADYKQKEKIVVKYLTKQGKSRIVYRDRIKTVTKYVKTIDNRECFNPLELQLYADNLGGKGSDTGSTPRRVPAITDTGRRDGKGPTAKLSGNRPGT